MSSVSPHSSRVLLKMTFLTPVFLRAGHSTPKGLGHFVQENFSTETRLRARRIAAREAVSFSMVLGCPAAARSTATRA